MRGAAEKYRAQKKEIGDMRRKRQNGEKQEIGMKYWVYRCTSIYTHMQGKTQQVLKHLFMIRKMSASPLTLKKRGIWAYTTQESAGREEWFSTLLELPKPQLICNLLALFSHSRAMSLHCVPFLLAVPTGSGTCWWPCANPCMLWESEPRQQYLCLLL